MYSSRSSVRFLSVLLTLRREVNASQNCLTLRVRSTGPDSHNFTGVAPSIMTAQFYRNGIRPARDGNLASTSHGKVSQVKLIGKVESATIGAECPAVVENVADKGEFGNTRAFMSLVQLQEVLALPNAPPLPWRGGMWAAMAGERTDLREPTLSAVAGR
jgi:hypothetical protein